MRFKAEIEAYVDDKDKSIVDRFDDVVLARFNGTPVKIIRVTVTKEKE